MDNVTFDISRRSARPWKQMVPATVLGFSTALVFAAYASAGPISTVADPTQVPRAELGGDLMLIHCCHNHPYSPNDRYCCHEAQYYAPGYVGPRYYAPGYNAGRAVVGGAVAYGTYKGVKKAYKKSKKVYKKYK